MFSQLFDKFIRRKSGLSGAAIRAMAGQNKFREVVEAHKNGQIDKFARVPDMIGYCYFQVADFDTAIRFLQKAVRNDPNAYYSYYFLGLSLQAVQRSSEAILPLIRCLQISLDRADEVLGHLLPIAVEELEKTGSDVFSEILKLIEPLGSDHTLRAKILFAQRRDAELSPEKFGEVRFCKISSVREYTNSGRGDYISLGGAEKLRFVRLDDKSEVRVPLPEPYYAEIQDALVMSGSSFVVTSDNEVLSDVLANKKFGHYVDTQYDKNVRARRTDALLIQPPPSIENLDEAIMLCGLASGAYGHWFAEFLPRLRFLENHPRFTELTIVVDDGMPQSHYDFLSLLVTNKLYRLKPGTGLRVSNLVIAPADTFISPELVRHHKVPPEEQGSLTVGALKFFGERVVKRLGPSEHSSDRIFLSRRKSQWRRLLNEEGVIAELNRLGFKTLYIEDYTFEEQVRIFQKADFVVAPNGSALNNLIFSKPEVKVLILGQEHLFNWGGWFGSFMELGYSFEYFAGDSGGNNSQKHIDYSISPGLVGQRVRAMLGH